MHDKLIDGKKLSEQILLDIKTEVMQLQRKPTLAVVLIGEDQASQIYIRNKKNACAKVGINSKEFLLPITTTETQLITLIKTLNQDPNIDGILVQLPLPKHLTSSLVIDTILPSKDVDGFHRYNMGSLALNNQTICPCTPHGVIYMLDSIKFTYPGKHIVIIGTSNIVGRPMALELLNKGATITVCNSKTPHLQKTTLIADVLIVAIGKAKLIKREWVKDNSIIIDVGINYQDNKICGDVDFEEVIDKVAYITPVPGGVGPMTIAMLIKNTMQCYKANANN